MTVAWLDHDFPLEHDPEPEGWMRVGTLLDVAVFTPTHLDVATPAFATSDGATGDSARTGLSGAGSPALAAELTRSQLIAQFVEVLIPQPSQWHSFVLGFLRRERVDRLEQLPVEVLHTLVEQSYTLNAARGGR